MASSKNSPCVAFPAVFACCGLLFLASCVAPPPPLPPQASGSIVKKADGTLGPMWEWRGDGLKGEPAVVVALDEQKAYLTIGGKDAGWTYLASGRLRFKTPSGSFRILEKTVDKHSNLWGTIRDAEGKVVVADARNGRDPVPEGGSFSGSTMPYWMRLTNDGIGMHVGKIPNPGLPASHGCIRLPKLFAERMFRVVKIGTPVVVQGETPSSVDYAIRNSGTTAAAGAPPERASRSTLR